MSARAASLCKSFRWRDLVRQWRSGENLVGYYHHAREKSFAGNISYESITGKKENYISEHWTYCKTVLPITEKHNENDISEHWT
jgi:macrodomain Ter protein organizer (MatP/YcbG family)